LTGQNGAPGKLPATLEVGQMRNIAFITILILTATLTIYPELICANDLTVESILANPEKYHQQNVSIVGRYHMRFEGMYLYGKKGKRIWFGEVAENSDIATIQEYHESFSRVQGLFRQIPYGHPYYPGEITQIHKIETISKNELSNPIGYKLTAIITRKSEKIAVVTDYYESGKGYSLKEGTPITGLISKKVKTILDDKIIIEEACHQCKGQKYKQFEIYLHGNN